MKWQWKLGRFLGIDVYVHATFVLLLGWIAYSYWLQFHELSQVLKGLLFILALFACVVFHEYGHALIARKYEIRTRDITLYPIGGVARLERMPDRPIEELWVALAGPAVNVVISVLLIAFLFLTRGQISLRDLSVASGDFLVRLLIVNIYLVLFNLIPAFPMDGGRVLRALLAMRLEYVRATQIAAVVGQGLALVFGFVGLFSNPFLLFIALFVWIGASQEASMVQMKDTLSGIPVSRAMIINFERLSASDDLGRVVDLILSGVQQDFPVTDAQDQLLGILTRDDFIRALSKQGKDAAVAEVMRKDAPQIDSHEMIESAVRRLQETGLKMLPVVHSGRLVGLITSENITELIMIRSALQVARSKPQTGNV